MCYINYRTWRFPLDFDLESFVFHTLCKRSKTFCPPPFFLPLPPEILPLFFPLPLPSTDSLTPSRVLSLSWIWVSIPTKSSSTLWFIPGDVSIYLQPYLTAKEFPAEKEKKNLSIVFPSLEQVYCRKRPKIVPDPLILKPVIGQELFVVGLL